MKHVETKYISKNELHPHLLAVEFWKDLGSPSHQDDEAMMKQDIDVNGVRVPLTVSPRKGGGYWVIDGCSRMRISPDGAELKCEVVEIEEEAIPQEIWRRNMARHTFTAAQRALTYIKVNECRVAAEPDKGGRPNKPGSSDPSFSKKGQKTKGSSDPIDLTSEEIATHAGVGDKDAKAALSLFRCNKYGFAPVPGKGLKEIRVASETEHEQVAATFKDVLSGQKQCRNWHTGMAGAVHTKGKDRKKTDWDARAKKTMSSFRNLLSNWGELTPAESAAWQGNLQMVLAVGPEWLKHMMRGLTVKNFPEDFDTAAKKKTTR